MSLGVLSYPDNDINPTQGSCGLCVCFEESDITEVVPGKFSYQFLVNSLPSNGDTFTLTVLGTTYTFEFVSGAPASWDQIQIGVSVTAVRNSIKGKLQSMHEFAPSIYTFTNVGVDELLIDALFYGSLYDLAFDFTLAPDLVQQSITPGIDYTLHTDYKVGYYFTFNGGCKTPDRGYFVIRPQVLLDKMTGDYSVSICDDLAGHLKAMVYTPPINLRALLAPQDIPEIIGKVSLIWGPIVNNLPFGEGFSGVTDLWIINAWCTEQNQNLDVYCPGVNNVISWLTIIPESHRRYCTGGSFIFYIILTEGEWTFNIIQDEQIIETYEIEVDPDTKIVYGIPLPSITVTGEESVISIEGSNDNDIDVETLNITLVNNRICCCSELIYFLNNLGAWEPLNVTCAREQGLTIETEDVINCRVCDVITQSNTVAGQFTHKNVSYTFAQQQSEVWVSVMERFFTSPEHYVSGPDGERRIKIVGFDETIVTQDNRIQIRFEWIYMDTDRNTHVNYNH